jgi:Na+-transporting NADH:ubiquinone oxidoreductase subunit A
MKVFHLKRGLDLPLSGAPEQKIHDSAQVSHVALLGDDYVDLKPRFSVQEGDTVALGQCLFIDKKNPGVRFTSPGAGKIVSIQRGAKRKFEAIIIELAEGEERTFSIPSDFGPDGIAGEDVRDLLVKSGLWTALRTRPYDKIPAIESSPNSLFITAMDTRPLAADPAVIINEHKEDFLLGLKMIQRLAPTTYLCTDGSPEIPGRSIGGIIDAEFHGPHPAGLPSTHIHFLDPAHQKKTVWFIGYPDVIAVGHLFRTGRLTTERIVSLAGPVMENPGLIRTRTGASLEELCPKEAADNDTRLLSGSVLNGRQCSDAHRFLGRFHHQICALAEGDGRGLFSWMMPGRDRYSTKKLFFSNFMDRSKGFAMNTAAWGGRRVIFPLGVYEEVMPLDFVITSLLKSLATDDLEKAASLGVLELVEEDLALCSFVCPGKNDFGPMLRAMLTRIDREC